MSVAIRGLQAGDTSVIAHIIDVTPLWQRHGFKGARATELMASASILGERVVVADDGGVVGFAWWMPRGAFGRPYLRLIGVHPERRSQAVGAVLLKAFEEDAATTARECFLLVSDFNTEAQRFYEKHGYTKVGELPRFVLPDAGELIYRKVLKPL